MAQDIAVVPYYGLASGFLTGKYRTPADLAGKARGKSAEKYLNDHGLGVLTALDKVAAEVRATPAQVASLGYRHSRRLQPRSPARLAWAKLKSYSARWSSTSQLHKLRF